MRYGRQQNWLRLSGKPSKAFSVAILGDNETVSIHAYSPQSAPTGQTREGAYRRLLEFGDKLAERVKDVPEDEIDATIDEAVDYIHHHRE